MSSTFDEALFKETDDRYLMLRESNRRLEAALAKEKARTSEMVEAAYRGAFDAASSLTIRPPGNPPKDARRKHAEVAIPILSDLQLAKVTPSYNSSVCAERVARYADKILELVDIQRHDHPVKRAHSVWLGDFVEGEMIFPGQAHLIDAGLYRQVMIDGPEILIPFVQRLLSTDGFESVEIDCVIGNHGRIGRRGDFEPETNSDRMLYRFVATLLERDPAYRGRVKFNIPDGRGERNWYRVMVEGEYRALCIHGDQIKGNGPWHGVTLAKKVNGWAAGAIREQFLDVFMGHYHQIAMIPLNHRKVYVCGSTESDNDFARETLSAQSDPKQWLLFCSPEKGRITTGYDVDLL